jgi:hypothetical protein
MCSTVASEQQVVTEAEMYFSLPQAEVWSQKKELFNLMGLPEAQGLLLSNFYLSQAVFWIQFRIGSGFSQVSGSGSEFRRAKMTQKNRKKY